MISRSSRLLGVTMTLLAGAACSSPPPVVGQTGGTSSSATTGSTSSAGGASSSSSAVASTSASVGSSGGAGGIGGGATASGTGGAAASSTASSSSVSSGSGGDVGDLDQDGDGWTPNEGDCCDSVGDCDAPQLYNPGAYEFPGNGVDDDCDPVTPDNGAPVDCGPPPLMVPTTGIDLVQAMNICQLTNEVTPRPLRKWGVIDATLQLADGSGTPKDIQTGVLPGFGPSVVPQAGSTMAAISTGSARSANNSGFHSPQAPNSYDANTAVIQPAQFLAAHNGVDPSAACPMCVSANCDKAYDSVDLHVRMRVPTNAVSFNFRHRFFTAEYPERICVKNNDFFLVLLKTAWTPDPNQFPPLPPLPLDHNIAFDAQKNLVSVDNAFLDVCFPPPAAPPGSCPGGTLDLVGNGYGGPGNNVNDGAATGWLIADAPMVPGEIIELDFVIWDALDHQGDSLALIDKFRWTAPINCGGPCPHP